MRRRVQRLLLGAHTRRMITIPAFVMGWIFGTLVFPVVIPGTAIADYIARRKLTVVRALLMAYVFITVEVIAIGVIAYLTAARPAMSRDRWLAAHDRLEGWWARVQFNWARRIFRLAVSVEGRDVLANPPYLLFVRHVSVLDNLLPAVFAVDAHRVSLKWVLNWYLLRDPCIDIVGHRIGCAFVRGGTDQSTREITRIRTMAQDLAGNQGVIIYPEGTLYSPSKRERVLHRLERSRDDELIEFTSGLRTTLPPRLGGTLALLELRPDLDVIFCSHSGLEDALDKASIVAGGLIGQEVRIKFWRVPAASIPRERPELRSWLFQQWTKVDRFAAAGLPEPVESSPAEAEREPANS
jgi:1-acyl-sn-glycerol-3-phosphate acyltransferase